MNDPHRVLDGDEALAALPPVGFGASETRQDQRLCAAAGMRAVELRRHLHRQRAAFERRGRGVRVGSRGGEVATEPDEHVDTAGGHRRDRRHGVVAVVARRVEREPLGEGVEQPFRRAFDDAHRAVALHVAVPPHRAQAGATATDRAAQQHRVDDLADRRDGLTVLGQPHRPAHDDLRRGGKAVDQRLGGRPVESGGGEQLGLVERLEVGGELGVSVAVGVDERPVDGPSLRGGAG